MTLEPIEPIRIEKSDEFESDEFESDASVVIKEPVVFKEGKKNMKSFKESLPNDWIEVHELTQMYNQYFGEQRSEIGFGMLQKVKKNFEKKNPFKKGKHITYYKKK